MAENQEFRLKETKGTFKLVGKVFGLNADNAFRDGETKSGKEYHSARFGVKTSPVNTLFVELFGMERDFVVAYSSKDKKSAKIDWDERDNPPKGYHVLGTTMYLKEGSKEGKYDRDVLVEFDAVPFIEDNLSDGDEVFVNGRLDFSEYEDKNGDTKSQTRFTIQSIGRTKEPVDFEAEDFKEVAAFEQEIVVSSVDVDKNEKKAYVNAYIIQYGDKFVTTQFVIDGNTHEKMFKAFPSKMKFGDFVKVMGQCINSVEVEEVEEAEEDEFGSERPNGLTTTVRNYTQELRITGLDVATWEKKKYTQDDFVVNEAEENFGDDDEDDPFNDNSDNEDDLPF